jgi:hypothetical protein
MRSYSRSVPQTIWVAKLHISSATATKISRLHGVQADEVTDAVQCVSGIPFARKNNPFGDVFHLGSVYPD